MATSGTDVAADTARAFAEAEGSVHPPRKDADDPVIVAEPTNVDTIRASEDSAEGHVSAQRPKGTTYERAVVAVLCIVGVQLGLRPLGDNSFLTHLATGRIILESGSVPTVDPYSFTAHGEPWTVQSWLASVVYASLERLGGLTAIRVLIAALTVALLLLVWRLTAPAKSLLPRLLLVGAVVSVGTTYWSERPLMFGLVGLALVLLAAEDGFHPAWLVPVMWVWVNTHGSFPFAPLVLVLLAVGRLLDGSSPGVEVRALLWCIAGIGAAAVNPLGPRLLVFPLGLMERREAFTAVAEWQAPAWDLWSQWIFALLAIVGLVAVLLKHRRWRSILPIVLFTAAAATSMRNLPQASIVIAAAAAPAFAGLGRVEAGDRRAINGPASVAFFVLAAMFALVGVAGPDTTLDAYPTDAAAWLERSGQLGPQSRVLASDVVGNYLEARFGPDEVQVFFDDRVDMYPMSVIDSYRLLRDESKVVEFESTLERIDPTVVLWEADSPFGRWLSNDATGWRVVHEADDWMVAVPT